MDSRTLPEVEQINHNEKVLVANRGEIACRVIRACRSLSVPCVAVYSEADSTAMHVEMADEALSIGGPRVGESYGSSESILEAAQTVGATAVHPGYGFMSESPAFAQAVTKAGITWIGPTAETISAMGDKSRARELARTANVPVLPGSERFAATDPVSFRSSAEEIGFPLLVKASGGGGGIGMKIVEDANQLHSAVNSIQSLVSRAFGVSTLYLERFVPSARHVEVQVFGYGDGTGVHLHERDCSIQRRFQKIIEEAPAPDLSAPVRDSLHTAALSLVSLQKYSGAGTVEFLVDQETQEAYFLEMNTRIQVEHPVTEMVTGVDLVQWQILHAFQQLPTVEQSDIQVRGHAIEGRVYAECPERNFLPSPGELEQLHWPVEHDGIRVDTGLRSGDSVTPFYDPLMGKIIAHRDDRTAAIARLSEALDDLVQVGVDSNVEFMKRILKDPRFATGTPSTTFVDEFRNREATV